MLTSRCHVTPTRPHLVNLLPAVLIFAAQVGVISEQKFTTIGISSHHGAVVERGQATTVLIVRRSTQVQEGLATATWRGGKKARGNTTQRNKSNNVQIQFDTDNEIVQRSTGRVNYGKHSSPSLLVNPKNHTRLLLLDVLRNEPLKWVKAVISKYFITDFCVNEKISQV